MLDNSDLFNYEFEQLQLDNLRRIRRSDQRRVWFERNKYKFIYVAVLTAFGIGYILGAFTR